MDMFTRSQDNAPSRNLEDFSPEYLAEDISAPLLTTCFSFLVIEAIFIVLMYISRYLNRDKKKGMWMVFLMSAGYLTCVGKIVIALLMIHLGGAGRHLITLSPGTRTHMLKLSLASQIVCPLTTSITKLSILVLFQTILGQASRTYRIIIRSTFIAVLLVLLVQVIIPFANCKPFSRNWEPMGPGSCAIPGIKLWRYLSLPNVITTGVMVAIPLPALYKLKVSKMTRLGLCLVFSVCLLGIVAAIMRFYSFLRVKDFADITYENITPLCWTISESGVYLVAGVMLTLKPLVKRLAGRDEGSVIKSDSSFTTYLHGEQSESERSVELDWEKLELGQGVTGHGMLGEDVTAPPEMRSDKYLQ